MLTFGQTVWLWRMHRGLTQGDLARLARIPRPMLSVIEQGQREVSLGTLRALALALGVRPGILADGVPPGLPDAAAATASREAMERVADAVARGAEVREPGERALAEALKRIVRHRADSVGHASRRLRRGKRASEAAWLWLEAAYPREVVRSLLRRIADRQAVAS